MGCNTLEDNLIGLFDFDTFVTVQRAPDIELFDKESVYSCGPGCSTYTSLDFECVSS